MILMLMSMAGVSFGAYQLGKFYGFIEGRAFQIKQARAMEAKNFPDQV